MDEEDRRRINNRCVIIPDLALRCVMQYIDDPRDRHAASLVCHQWYEIDALTRKHITIAMCYSTTPELLMKRFPLLESLKVKGKPRAAMFASYKLIPEDWGGYASPWIQEIAAAGFHCLKSLHFRRMIVTDEDLELLAQSPRGPMLHTLKLDYCSGFSTNGLLLVALSCKCLKTLFLEKSSIETHDGKWLHELALHNTTLENLNFYLTKLSNISIQDLELIAKNCRSLVSVKISLECEILKLIKFFRAATVLKEFGGGSISVQPDNDYTVLAFPPRLCSLVAPTCMKKDGMPMVFPFANLLKKLDLTDTFLNTDDHCVLLQRCPNLEVLQTRDAIGDRGLEVLAQHCKKLRRLRIEMGPDEDEVDEQGGFVNGVVSQRGLSALAQGCVDLEYISVYVSDITNACLETIGTFCKNLRDFRLVLFNREDNITELPLDNGVRALLRGCQNIRRFALYLHPGGLTDVGLRHVGEYGNNVRWMLLGYVGESDTGLLEFSRGCPNLQKLELKGCCFSERALALSVMQLTSLRYLWSQGYVASPTRSSDLLHMDRPYWNIESIRPRRVVYRDNTIIDHPAQLLAYYSLVGQRTDHPATVDLFYPDTLLKL